MEDKQKIMNLLCRTLQETRNASDLISLTYLPHEDAVIIKFENGRRMVNAAPPFMDTETKINYRRFA